MKASELNKIISLMFTRVENIVKVSGDLDPLADDLESDLIRLNLEVAELLRLHVILEERTEKWRAICKKMDYESIHFPKMMYGNITTEE